MCKDTVVHPLPSYSIQLFHKKTVLAIALLSMIIVIVLASGEEAKWVLSRIPICKVLRQKLPYLMAKPNKSRIANLTLSIIPQSTKIWKNSRSTSIPDIIFPDIIFTLFSPSDGCFSFFPHPFLLQLLWVFTWVLKLHRTTNIFIVFGISLLLCVYHYSYLLWGDQNYMSTVRSMVMDFLAIVMNHCCWMYVIALMILKKGILSRTGLHFHNLLLKGNWKQNFNSPHLIEIQTQYIEVYYKFFYICITLEDILT